MTGNEVQVFNFEQNCVRTVSIDNEPWFVLKDVCDVLELTTPARVAERLDGDEVSQTHIIDSLGRNQSMTIINESGLYSVVLRSDKPQAKPFRKWVTSEVLPSIRKTGAYQRPMTTAEMFAMQAQLNIENEKRLAALQERAESTERRLNEAVAVFAAPVASKDVWQEQMNKSISRIVETFGLNHQVFRGELYTQLEQTAGVNLSARQTRLKTRLRKGGATYKEAAAVTKLQVIAQDQKLKPIFEGIVRNEAAKRACAVWTKV